MNKLLEVMMLESGTLAPETIILYIFSSAVLSFAIYISYWMSHSSGIYSKKFNVSLIMLTVLTATVMTVIGNNIALSLGMVGALSIVRFRTAIKDSRDAIYIFWAIIIGICCGVGDYFVAAVGSAVVFIILIFFGKINNNNRFLIIIKARRSIELEIEGEIFKYFNHQPILKVKNTSQTSVELIFEMSKKTYELSHDRSYNISDKIYSLGDVDYVNIITQSDEISG